MSTERPERDIPPFTEAESMSSECRLPIALVCVRAAFLCYVPHQGDLASAAAT